MPDKAVVIRGGGMRMKLMSPGVRVQTLPLMQESAPGAVAVIGGEKIGGVGGTRGVRLSVVFSVWCRRVH